MHKDEKIWKKIGIFITLMVCIYLMYYLVLFLMSELEERNFQREIYDLVFTSDNELTVLFDCAPIIDRYGADREYLLEFELKSEVCGKVYVHIMGTASEKYTFIQTVESTNDFQKYKIKVVPQLVNIEMTTAYLCFYGEYGSGVCSTVRKVSFSVIK